MESGVWKDGDGSSSLREFRQVSPPICRKQEAVLTFYSYPWLHRYTIYAKLSREGKVAFGGREGIAGS